MSEDCRMNGAYGEELNSIDSEVHGVDLGP